MKNRIGSSIIVLLVLGVIALSSSGISAIEQGQNLPAKTPTGSAFGALQERVTALETSQADLVRTVEAIRATPTVAARATITATATKVAGTEELDIEVFGADVRVVDRNNVYVTVAYIVTLKSNSAHTSLVNATVDFLDDEGFIMHTATARNLLLNAYEEKGYSETTLINVGPAANIVSTNTSITLIDHEAAPDATPPADE